MVELVSRRRSLHRDGRRRERMNDQGVPDAGAVARSRWESWLEYLTLVSQKRNPMGSKAAG